MKINLLFHKIVHDDHMSYSADIDRLLGDEGKLLTRYFDLCFEAIQQNKNRFPFQQIWSAIQNNGLPTVLKVELCGERSVRSYLINLNGCELLKGITLDPKRIWSVDKFHILELLENEKACLENPAKLNWEWLYD